MDPSIRTQQRFRTNQQTAKEFMVRTRDIPDTATSEHTPPLPAGSENFTDQMRLKLTLIPNLFLTAGVVCISYIVYKRYILKK